MISVHEIAEAIQFAFDPFAPVIEAIEEEGVAYQERINSFGLNPNGEIQFESQPSELIQAPVS